MTKYTKKQLKAMVRDGIAIDVTHASSQSEIPEYYTKVGYAESIYGCGGMLLKGISGQLYAVTDRTNAIYLF